MKNYNKTTTDGGNGTNQGGQTNTGGKGNGTNQGGTQVPSNPTTTPAPGK